MGCKPSQLKEHPTLSNVTTRESLQEAPPQQQFSTTSGPARSNSSLFRSTDRVYKLLQRALHQQQQNGGNDSIQQVLLDERAILQAMTPETAAYRHPAHQTTPLHLVAQLVGATTTTTTASTTAFSNTLVNITQELLLAHPDAIRATDTYGHIPLHYAIRTARHLATLPLRSAVVRVLLQHDPCRAYWLRNDVSFACEDEATEITTEDGASHLCSPLYHVLLHLPDDPTTKHPPTLEWIRLLLDRGIPSTAPLVPNPDDGGDAPLALLYRRFTRQFDRAEAFFAGDNSRPEVLAHRKYYTTAAGHTWKCIELLLQHQPPPTTPSPLYRTVHRAVATGRTPPDVLRYMIETHAADVRVPDEHGKCPLHYAASAVTIPPSYSKYVLEELLYKYPEAAAKRDINDQTPLQLAIAAKKQWVSGGVKALYDAYPEALQDVDLEAYPHIRAALRDDDDDDETSTEQYDAIVQVQQPDASILQVVTSMWAHEEDAGVQLLGCVSIVQSLVHRFPVAHVAPTAVPAVVNAMKAHPNEAIVQEKACAAIAALSAADGVREVSLVATGAVAAVVGALQAHVSDATVQHAGCVALTKVCQLGPMHATVVASVSGLTALLNAMAAHPHDAAVQIAACQALVALTDYHNDTAAWVPPLERSQAEPLLQTATAQFHECSDSVDVLWGRMVGMEDGEVDTMLQ